MHNTDELVETLSQIDPTELNLVILMVKEIREEKEWPKETTVYIHGDEDSNYETGKKLGLSEDAAETFRGTGYEVGLIVTVTKNGRAMLTAIDGPSGPVKLVEPIVI